MKKSKTQTFKQKKKLQQAILLHRKGNLEQAGKQYGDILKKDPHQPEALHCLGVICYQTGKFSQAIILIQQAIDINSENPFYHNNLGLCFAAACTFDKAITCYEKAIILDPSYFEAHYNLGTAFYAAGVFEKAVVFFEKAVHIQPENLAACTNLAASLNETGAYDRSVAVCEKALKTGPETIELLNNLGNALKNSGKAHKAVACFKKCLQQHPKNAQILCNLANALYDAGKSSESIEWFEKAIAANPSYGEAYNDMGVVFRGLRMEKKAAACFEKALELKPDDARALHNIGNLYKDAEMPGKAETYYKKAISKDPGLYKTHINLGIVLQEQNRCKEALSCYENAVQLKPDAGKPYSHMVHLLRENCNWDLLKPYEDKLTQLTQYALNTNKKPDEMPFLNLTRCQDPGLNLKVAAAWSRDIKRKVSHVDSDFTFHGKKEKDKLTIGYLSNNFKNHPTSHLVGGIFNLHDRNRFNVNCYSYGKDDNSYYRKKIQKECDRFVDIFENSHLEAARRIFNDGVDILVDLAGFMKGCRTEICALKPSPIQVRWLGMAGTSGADFYDYIILDPVVVPDSQMHHYSETLVHMPDCYQVNSSMPVIGSSVQREDVDLPEKAFVFCCFCSSYKIEPGLFDIWMTILKKTPESVLWLLKGNAHIVDHLTCRAESKGIDPGRLVFADKLKKEDHLARLRMADLFLDTQTVNGAATTSDALWAGVPVITIKGNHFASRMSSGILNAIGLNELSVCDAKTYQDMAIDFGNNPHKLDRLKQNLKRNIKTLPLFNASLFIKNMEKAYENMWDVFIRDKNKKMIRVSDL